MQATIDKIEKDYGKGTIMKLGDQPEWSDAQVIPSGSVALDHALGIGGYPRGRIIEIYGPESSGKTTLAIHAIAQAQKAGGQRKDHAGHPCNRTGPEVGWHRRYDRRGARV